MTTDSENVSQAESPDRLWIEMRCNDITQPSDIENIRVATFTRTSPYEGYYSGSLTLLLKEGELGSLNTGMLIRFCVEFVPTR